MVQVGHITLCMLVCNLLVHILALSLLPTRADTTNSVHYIAHGMYSSYFHSSIGGKGRIGERERERERERDLHAPQPLPSLRCTQEKLSHKRYCSVWLGGQ